MSMSGLLKSLVHWIIVGHASAGDEDHRDDEKKMKIVVEDDDEAGFQMPLHYPRYVRSDYETMEEWKVDTLLREYGLMDFKGDLDEKRRFAMGAFLWPDQF